MDSELKAKWVAALRSGEYQQQTEGRLGDKTAGYCCLGVLCIVAGKPFEPDAAFPNWDTGITIKIQEDLANRNDGATHEQHSFLQIADLVENSL